MDLLEGEGMQEGFSFQVQGGEEAPLGASWVAVVAGDEASEGAECGVGLDEGKDQET